MRFTLLAILAGVAAMTGCAPAVAIHPLYTTQNLVFDLPLEGTWQSGDSEVWQVTRTDGGYAAESSQGPKYTLHLLRLNEYEFVDVASQSDPGIGVAGHLFGKISMQDGQLYISTINETWLKHMREGGLAPQATVGEGQQIIFTASTSELQQFLLQHAADPGAWDEDDDGLHRLR